ncbi:TPM domain-containing protein [Maribacter sp. MMG018]|uniref:TPM domain-containing protein n=1 Tax=Maribacter sp. MMG018 TaxID=2822688 RepID=UPI001B39A09C|nr:TPM domain-containing protein [Maribacter sp. MMG018]MBQ4913010.1 TPM domain-containing protein [Maribacter sp. MMG018]
MYKKTFIILFLLSFMCARGQQQYYELRDFVTDSAHIFSSEEARRLNQKLQDFEKETTNQVVVVTIEQLGFETIEGYANGLFNQNGVGASGKDNGLLILFAESDREVRIEVGYGLEPYITDAVASRIIRNTMIPLFKKERYYEGIDDGVDQIIEFLNNPEAIEEFKNDIAASERKGEIIGFIFMGVFVLVFVGVGGFLFYSGYRVLVEVFRGVFMGKLGVIPGFFMLISSSFSSLFALAFVVIPLGVGYSVYTSSNHIDTIMEGVLDNPYNLWWGLVPFYGIAACIALIKLKLEGKKDLKISWIKNDEVYYRRTFSSSGTHALSSGSGSSGGSSSSFSGGGGSSGGGGASGSW